MFKNGEKKHIQKATALVLKKFSKITSPVCINSKEFFGANCQQEAAKYVEQSMQLLRSESTDIYSAKYILTESEETEFLFV